MALDCFHIQFLDSMQYMSGSLANLAKQFRLPVFKGHFAHTLNKPINYNLGNSNVFFYI